MDEKFKVELTLWELENIIVCLRMVNECTNGTVRSKLEERLSDIAMEVKSNS